MELKGKINWADLLSIPDKKTITVQCPAEPIYIPKRIRSFQVHSLPPEEVLKNFKANNFPDKKDFNNDKLSFLEKSKLQFYKLFFKKEKNNKSPDETISKPTSFLNHLGAIINMENTYIERMKKDYDDLFKRNQKQFDKLMELFKEDPMEALKYAIPIDENGISRGSSAPSEMGLSQIWRSFELFDSRNKSVGRGGGINLGDNLFKLKEQYLKTAQDLIKKGEHQKAAFIYMRLLKDFSSAAWALEQGGFFQEAASIYLKHVRDKEKAANCFEKGRYYKDALELFKELRKYEKVGDLYVLIDNRKDANINYELAIDIYKTQFQFVKAAVIYRNKMDSPMKSQTMLLEGWRQNKDAFNCLNNYFQNLDRSSNLMNEIYHIFKTEVNPENRRSFLKVIHFEYRKHNEIKNEIRNIAYEIISLEIKADPTSASELMLFNENDHELLKDIIRIKHSVKK